MHGGGASLCGQLEAEWNKESICTWGSPSTKYQSPSRVRGACLWKGGLEWGVRVWAGWERYSHGLGTIQHFVIAQPEVYKEDTHMHAYTLTCTFPKLLSNERNWEIMSTYSPHIAFFYVIINMIEFMTVILLFLFFWLAFSFFFCFIAFICKCFQCSIWITLKIVLYIYIYFLSG